MFDIIGGPHVTKAAPDSFFPCNEMFRVMYIR